jgi:hypothetical protein
MMRLGATRDKYSDLFTCVLCGAAACTVTAIQIRRLSGRGSTYAGGNHPRDHVLKAQAGELGHGAHDPILILGHLGLECAEGVAVPYKIIAEGCPVRRRVSERSASQVAQAACPLCRARPVQAFDPLVEDRVEAGPFKVQDLVDLSY